MIRTYPNHLDMHFFHPSSGDSLCVFSYLLSSLFLLSLHITVLVSLVVSFSALCVASASSSCTFSPLDFSNSPPLVVLPFYSAVSLFPSSTPLRFSCNCSISTCSFFCWGCTQSSTFLSPCHPQVFPHLLILCFYFLLQLFICFLLFLNPLVITVV